MRRRFWGVFIFVLGALAPMTLAFAQSLPFDPSSLANIDQLIDPAVARALVGSVGRLGDFRPYQPATPLMRGLDIGLEATVEKVDDDLRAALKTLGASSTSIPALPIAKVHFHKGVGDNVDVGVVLMSIRGYVWLWGLTGKVVVYNPEEGPTWALRLNYASSEIYFVKAKTWTPQIVVSRRIEFADPYIGVGWQFVNGEVDITQNVAGFNVRYNKSASTNSGMAFLGLALRAPEVGFKITLEGAYNQSNAHTLGVKIGFEI